MLVFIRAATFGLRFWCRLQGLGWVLLYGQATASCCIYERHTQGGFGTYGTAATKVHAEIACNFKILGAQVITIGIWEA